MLGRWPELVLHADDYGRCMKAWRRALRKVPITRLKYAIAATTGYIAGL